MFEVFVIYSIKSKKQLLTIEKVSHSEAFPVAACVNMNFVSPEVSLVPWHTRAGIWVLITLYSKVSDGLLLSDNPAESAKVG